MALKQITPPANPAVDVDYVKTKLRVEHAEHDVLLEALIAAQTGYAEGPDGFTGRALVDQTWDLFLDAFPGCGFDRLGLPRRRAPRGADAVIEIPLPPLIEVTEFTYQDADGVEQTVDASLYVVDSASEPGRIVLLQGSAWPTARQAANAVRIRFRAGYLDQGVSPEVDAVPDVIKLGIYLRVAADYGPFEPTAAAQLRDAGEQVLRQKRIHLGMA